MYWLVAVKMQLRSHLKSATLMQTVRSAVAETDSSLRVVRWCLCALPQVAHALEKMMAKPRLDKARFLDRVQKFTTGTRVGE